VFGSNREATGLADGTAGDVESEPSNYIVSRLNPDGTIDSTFGNNGNVFIDGSTFSNVSTGFFSGNPLLVDVSDNGEITVAFRFINELSPPDQQDTLAVIRFSF